jgi:hypothetical protein
VNRVNGVIMAFHGGGLGTWVGMKPNVGSLNGWDGLDDGREVPKPHLSTQARMVVQWRTKAWQQRRGRRWVGEGYYRLPSSQADGAQQAPNLPAGDESAHDHPEAFAQEQR